jgi:hypothetical protein
MTDHAPRHARAAWESVIDGTAPADPQATIDLVHDHTPDPQDPSTCLHACRACLAEADAIHASAPAMTMGEINRELGIPKADPYAAARERARLQLEADLAGANLDQARATLRDASKASVDAQNAYVKAQAAVNDAEAAAAPPASGPRDLAAVRQFVAYRLGKERFLLPHMLSDRGRDQAAVSITELAAVLAFIDGQDA